MLNSVILGWKRNNRSDLFPLCNQISEILAINGFNIYTGGGDGFMKEGNKESIELTPVFAVNANTS